MTEAQWYEMVDEKNRLAARVKELESHPIWKTKGMYCEHCNRVDDENASLSARIKVLESEKEAMRNVMAEVRAVVVRMPSNECTCGADDGDNLGSGGQETGCYMHELIAALSPQAKAEGCPHVVIRKGGIVLLCKLCPPPPSSAKAEGKP